MTICKFAAYTGQAIGTLEMVPKALRLGVIKHKRKLVGPSAGGNAENLIVQLTAIHGRQIDKRSVCHRYMCASKRFRGHLVTGHD